MGWTLYTLELLRKIPGLELTVLDSQCCGIAGTYGFKKENYPTSQAIGAPLFRQIEESGADLVVTDCETCNGRLRCPQVFAATSDYAAGPGAGLNSFLMPGKHVVTGHFCVHDSVPNVCVATQ